MGRIGFRRKCRSGKSRTSSKRNTQADKEPRHRASPMRIVRLYNDLTPEQRKMIEDAGFGGLLKIGCPTLPLGFCGWLLRRFDTDHCELVIKGRGRIPVTSDSVHRVLGIPNGGGDVKYGLDVDAIAFMSDKLGASGRYSPTVSSIENSLKQMKSADEHFLRTFMVLVISSFLCPTTSLRISPRCFPALVNIGSIRELNWCKFVVDQLRKSISSYGRKSSVPGCLFYLVILYLDSLDTHDIQIPDGTPRISAWNKKLVNQVIQMDMKNNGSFGKCLLKKRVDDVNPRGASSTFAILGGIPEIADFVSANVAAGYSAQKKELLSNAVGKLCASITNALSKFMHEVSALEGSNGEAGRDCSSAPVENNDVNNVDENDSRDEEDVLPEDSSELPTEDMEDSQDTSANEYEDESSMDGGSRDNDSEDDPDWEQNEFNSSKQKHVRTKPGDGVTKSEKESAKGSGHDSDNRKGNQETGNGCTEEHANLMKRMFSCVDGGTSQARSTRQKTGVGMKTAVQIPGSPLHVEGRPSSSGPMLCDDLRLFRVKEEMENMAVIDLCTPSSESDCVVLKTRGNPSSVSVDGPKRAS